MKKLLLSLIFVLFYATITFAQLMGGIKGGINVGDIIVSNRANYFAESTFNSRISYHFGSYVQNSFSDHFSWRVEMLFSNKGYIFKTEETSANVSLNYLNWPLFLVYNVSNKLDFEAGLEVGYMITGEDLYKDFDLGLDIGLRYDLFKKINLGLRYSHGFPFKMNVDSPDFTGEAPRYQHSILQLSLGYNLIYEPRNSVAE
ncbi:MAG: PorT family protein [Bacteroidales bacterium]|nr:PorT family protein [Bacteroidales bacterium]